MIVRPPIEGKKTYTLSKKEFDKRVAAGLIYFSNPLSVTGESYRVLNHWRTEGIIPEKVNTRLSVVELVWIRIVQELRRFGLSLEAIKKVHAEIHDKKNDELPYPKIVELIDQLWNGKNSLLAVDKEGRIKFIPENAVTKFVGSPAYQNSILLSFKNIVDDGLDAMDKMSIDRVYESDGLLTEEELLVLQLLREKKCNKIIVTKRNGIVDLIEGEDVLKGNTPLHEILKGQQYSKIEFIQNNNNIVCINRTIQIKTKKK